MIEILNGRNCFYQWDINQKIKVNEAAIKEIHYDNGTGTALVCSVYDYNGQRVADVPNILLTNYWAIKVYAYCGECVRFENIYEVKKRSKPDDYVYTETEVKRYETLESRIEALENGGGTVVVGAVNSVNGKDGDVVLTAADVGALPDDTVIPVVPTKVSAFTNDAGYLKQSSLNNYYTKTETNTAIDTAIAAIPKTDLTNYYTKAQTNTAIGNATKGLASESYVNTAINEVETALYVPIAADGGKIDCEYSEIVGQNKPVYLVIDIEGNKALFPLVAITEENAAFSGALMGQITTYIIDSSGNIIDIGAEEIPTDNSQLENGAGYITQDIAQQIYQKGVASGELKGEKGDKGNDGVSITSVKQTTTSTADDGNNVITVSLSNGTTSTFKVQNGSKGSAGKTPEKGTDYYTEADKQEMVSAVLAEIPPTDLSGYYTKTQTNSAISNAVKGLASETYVNTEIAALVGTAPETLDTLGEIATALETNSEVVATLNAAIGTKANKTELNGLASETYVNNAIAAIPPTDLSNYYTKTQTNSQITNSLSSYAKKTDIPSLTGYATENYVNTQIAAIPETDLTNYYTKAQTDNAINAAKPDLTPYATKANSETWTFTLSNGTTITKKVVLA